MPLAPHRRSRIATATAAVCALLAALVLDAPAAAAASYPSWDDVMAARGQESATESRVAELRTMLADLRSRSQAVEAEAERLGTEYQAAQRDAEDAAERESRLRTDAEHHADLAAESAAQAGQLAAQLGRRGADTTAQLLASGHGARDLLYDLGTMSRLGEQAERIETSATADAAVARSLTAQADRASAALRTAATTAARHMADAQAASDRAQVLVTEQQDNEARLQAQLATLTSGRVRTEAEFAVGEAARRAAEAAARQAAAQAAENARIAAAAAAAAAAARPGGSGSVTTPGAGSASGWVRPGGGGISSSYGYRVNPVSGVWSKHDGVDLASGCSTAIVAATAGTVEYVGRYGGYGNYVRIDHGGGVKTAYGHIVDGGFRVANGQRVGAGQLVALVGSTGNSTGCHLHFETHVGGATTDPVPFMAARGVGI